MSAIPFRPMEKDLPPNAAGPAYFSLLKAWCEGLGADWDDVMQKAGIRDQARSTKNRMSKGEASLGTAIAIQAVLKEIQDKSRKEPPAVGPQALLLREWFELGARLAKADPAQFEDIFERVRKIVAGAEAAAGFTRPK
jgi:hypothetical protein